MSPAYIVTLDVGTTSVKVCLFDEKLRLCASSSEEYTLLIPGEGMVELAPDTYLRAVNHGIASVLRGVDPKAVKNIAVTTQGETLIPIDSAGTPLHNAIVWIDARAQEEAAHLRSQIGNDAFYRHTGMQEAGPATPLCKVLWFKRNLPAVYAKTHKFLLLMDYLAFYLTGEPVTDMGISGSSGWLDINTGALWAGILDKLGVDQALFPRVLPCGAVAGMLRAPVARELGLSPDVCVTLCGMDQIASAVGAGNITPGVVTETTGTALVICATVDRPDYEHPAKASYLRHYNERFLVMPYCTTAGLLLKWFKDEFCAAEGIESVKQGISVYALLDKLAEAAPPGSAGLIVLPHFAGKNSPDMNPAATGVFSGVTLGSKKEHFIRAILESVGYMLRENLALIEQLSLSAQEIRSLGGGAKSELWNTIKADICQKRVVTLTQEESTSLGAGMLGAVSCGLYRCLEQIDVVSVRRVFAPDAARAQVYEQGYRRFLDLYQKLF